jgi:aminoglycoside/choline kinase family phosphotransferase
MKAKGNHPGKGVSSGGSPSSHVRASELPERVVDFLVGRGSSAAGRFRTLALEGDASDRHYFRLVLEGSSGERPDSYVLMKLASPWKPEGGRGELPFVNIARHLREKGIPVPRIFVDASEQGFVLLEDVGSATLEQTLEKASAGARRKRYEHAIELLVRMQREATRASRRPCIALTYAFDTATFFKELCFFREHALEGLWGRRMSADERKELEGHFRRLCEEIIQYPQVFTHRDYHSRNLMVQADRLTVLDFQDARLGPITYDLASLLRDSYVFLTSEEQEALIATYRGLARRAGLTVLDEEAFRKAFLQTGLQRNLKAIGTFAYQAVVKGVDRYLAYIPNTVNSIRFVFENDPRLAPFKRALQPYVEGL